MVSTLESQPDGKIRLYHQRSDCVWSSHSQCLSPSRCISGYWRIVRETARNVGWGGDGGGWGGMGDGGDGG